MSKQVNHLGVPPMDLTITDAGNGKLKVELQVPASSGSKDNIPFLEVTRNEQAVLLNGARQDMLSKLSQSGFTIGDVKYEAGGEQSQHGGVSGDGKVPKLGKVSFEISSDSKIHGGVSTTLHNNPDLAGAIRDTEKNFDTRRQNIYEDRAREWHRDGGATLKSNGETYTVTKDAAKDYINERHPLNWNKRVSADDGGIQVADASTLVPGNDRVNKQFAQALNGANGDKDAAAMALATISDAKGYKPDQDISVMQGKNGLIVSQGQGDAALNLQVPQAKQGDFEKIATQMAQPQQNQQVALQPEQQQERKGPSMA
ncbi:MAG: hypothetical protein ABL934_03800 [Lysobacteraceae bacterium]